MTLADGAGKTVSVPLSQPTGATAGGDTTKLKLKEEVKTGEFGRVEPSLAFGSLPDSLSFDLLPL